MVEQLRAARSVFVLLNPEQEVRAVLSPSPLVPHRPERAARSRFGPDRLPKEQEEVSVLLLGAVSRVLAAALPSMLARAHMSQVVRCQ